MTLLWEKLCLGYFSGISRVYTPREGGAAMAWHGCAGINLSINTSPIGGWCACSLHRYLDGDDPGEGFRWCRLHDEPLWHCLEEAEGRSRRWVRLYFQAMRQRVGLVVCSESSEGLEPWKADGVGRILNQALLGPGWHGAQIAGCHFTQFAEISGSRWWLRLGSGGPMTGTLACLFWLWWVGGGSMPCFVWLFWPR